MYSSPVIGINGLAGVVLSSIVGVEGDTAGSEEGEEGIDWPRISVMIVLFRGGSMNCVGLALLVRLGD
jgi:hypothetical protein